MKKGLLLLLLIFISPFVKAQQKTIEAFKLTCNFKINPLGVESPKPTLSWQLASQQRNQVQKAYRVLVADNVLALQNNQGNIWDSGKISSDQSIQIAFNGKTLQSAKKYYWKVMVWDIQNQASAWSAVSFWQMGLLQEKDWSKASWIALEKIEEKDKLLPALHASKTDYHNKGILPQCRKEIILTKKVKQATAFVAGLGHFEFFLNGKKVGNHFLDAGWTNYLKTAQYVTFDISKQILSGKNAFGIMLGNGFYSIPNERYWKILQVYGYPTCKIKILLEYIDGSSESIITDETWKVSKSPITYSSIYGGEDFDARLEQKGWKSPNFNDTSWQKPLLITEKMPELRSQQQEPLGYFESFTPNKITQIKKGIWVYDLAQNFSGIFAIEATGKMGNTIKITPAELINDDGTTNQSAIGEPVFFNYTLKGEGIEKWQPQFMYYGFRYVQIEGAVPEGEANPDNLPVIKKLTGIHTRNAAQKIGSFSCSNTLFNETYKLIDWSVKSNMASVLTDCPHREKLGWLEEAYLMGTSLRYNYDLATLYPKIIEDMRSSQLDNGLIPDIAPEYVPFEGGFRDSPEWGSAGIIVPWQMYEWYGNEQVLKDNYDMMKRYLAYLSSRAKNHIVSHGLGDWYDYGPKHPGVAQLTSIGLTATAIYYHDITILANIAKIVGKTEDELSYRKLGEEVKKAFNDKFFDKAKMRYENGSQTAFAMPLAFGLVEPVYKEAVFQSLLASIKENNYALTAGDIGFHYLVSALQNGGASDVIFKMNSRNDVAGYGYQLEHGATSLTESWNALRNVSNNHFMLGHLQEWFFNGLGGIKPAENSHAFKEFIIKPEMVGDVTATQVSFEVIYGQIKSHWKKSTQGIEMYVEIPVNTTAKVYLPTDKPKNITENGRVIKAKVLSIDNQKTVLQLGSGKYKFLIKER